MSLTVNEPPDSLPKNVHHRLHYWDAKSLSIFVLPWSLYILNTLNTIIGGWPRVKIIKSNFFEKLSIQSCWENQPTWNVTSSELAHSRIFFSYNWFNKLGLINQIFFPSDQYFEVYGTLFFFCLTAKMGFFGIWAQNILRSSHRHKDFLLFQQSLCTKIIQCLCPYGRGQKSGLNIAKMGTEIQVLRLKIPVRQQRHNVFMSSSTNLINNLFKKMHMISVHMKAGQENGY